jgi:hypothetical protein
MTTAATLLPGVYATTTIQAPVVKAANNPLLNQAARNMGDCDLVIVAIPAGQGLALQEAITEHLARSVEHQPGCEHATGDATDEHQLAAPTTTPEEGTR